MASAAEVVKIMGRTGVRGVTRFRCKVLDGEDKDKVLVRNAVGPLRIGDIVMIKETEMESVGSLGGRR